MVEGSAAPFAGPGILRGIRELATCPSSGGQSEIGRVPDAALVWTDRVEWAGPEAELPAEFGHLPEHDAGGRAVIPGLVDCHTHLAFGGWRAEEWARRLAGATYQEIAAGGGGILSTVRATRAASHAELVERALGFARDMHGLGVTTIECKSGYGLTTEHELRLLRVYRRVAELAPVRLTATLLAAHVVPPEFRSDRDAYVDQIIEEMIPVAAAESLAEACDVFVEEGAFTADEARRILGAASAHGLAGRLHADQLSDGDGGRLAAELGVRSADHLECVSADGIRAMAEAGVVGGILPLATLYLNQAPPPARAMIDAGVPVAIATDFNPGTAPAPHLPLALSLACNWCRMTPAECLKGATVHAARVLGLEGEVGSLEPGCHADFCVLEAESVEEWLYYLRPNAVAAVRSVPGAPAD